MIRKKRNGKFFKHISANKWIVLALIAVFIYSVIDFYDLKIAIGWGIFSKLFKPNPVEAITAILLFYTLNETIKVRKETNRQTELAVRPYLRIAWNAKANQDDRILQGITDTCIVAINEGNGLMRQVNYNITVNGGKVPVKRHSIIVPHIPTTVVYGYLAKLPRPILGNRNDKDYLDENNRIIKEDKIIIKGSYRDIEGGSYSFQFDSDPNEQSWFRERFKQDVVNR